MKELYPHQLQAIEAIRDALRSGSKRPVLQAATGFGKTIVAASMIRGARAKGHRVIFTAPAIELINQTVAAFVREGFDPNEIGVMQANHLETYPDRPIQVCSVQTLAKRKRPDAGLVIVDECHRMHKSVTSWIADPAWARVPFVGMSATPWTKGLGKIYDRLVIGGKTADLIRDGYLCPFKAFAPAHPDLTGVKTVRGDYDEGQLSAAMQKKTLVGDIVTTWLARASDLATFVFAVDCAHAKAIQRQFEDARVECGYLDAKSTRQEREDMRKAFALRSNMVIVNVGILTTGIDWDVRCIILARPTKSEILYVQMIGRGLRNALGKKELLILDHSDTTLRLGFVTDIHHEELSDGKIAESVSEKAEPKPHECPACAFLKPAGVFICPSCGHEPERLANVAMVAGEIVELSERRRARDNRSTTWEEKIEFMGGLKRYRLMTGKAEGWVAHQYKARFGVWPNDPQVRYAVALPTVPQDVSSFIKSRQIAWANRRDRA